MSPAAARDAFHQSEAFFQGGWTQEHTGFLIVFIVLLLVWWFKPGKGA